MAAAEFCEQLNLGNYNLFAKEKTGMKLKAHLCFCDPDIIDINRLRGIRNAKKILELGLQQIKSKT
ncbi:hypothetical protein EC844_1101 [Acinetobacter calcoaceticus]|uniref:Uncharacterized protein n=1 Tax=Acinetobacter calcoaceticus TaxID=471 RepID=A0A4R1XWN1_ACICA|nr:hypothetical protein EC844_1101 [Acinetobacter calcoaceticus]